MRSYLKKMFYTMTLILIIKRKLLTILYAYSLHRDNVYIVFYFKMKKKGLKKFWKNVDSNCQ